MINRAALLIRPKEPYLTWAATRDDTAAEAAACLRDKTSVYLVGEDPAGRDESALLEQYFEQIFERELEAWWTEEEDWPEVRDLATFRRWFSVEAQAIVVDLEFSEGEVEELGSN